MMNVSWTFDRGHLIATDASGKVLCSWAADTALGLPLVDLLNQSPQLSTMLLLPIVDGKVG